MLKRDREKHVAQILETKNTFKNHGVISFSPGITLARGRVHEVMGPSADIFAILAAARTDGPILWAGRAGNVETLAPTGLQDFIDPARFIVVTCITRDDVLWTTEQALRQTGATCVVAELENGPDLKTSRRLQIAAEEGGGLGIIVISGRAQTSAAQTRWLCNPDTDGNIDEGSSWVWKLVKNKAGKVGTWHVHWSSKNKRSDDASGLVFMAASSAA